MRFLSWLLVAVVVSGGVARADDLAAAKEHYRRGATLYDLRRYKEAAKEYELAFEAKDDAALLFNIGQAYRLANEPAEAIASYRAYLRRMPNAKNRIEVEVFIEELTKQVEQQKRAQEAKPTEAQPLSPPVGQAEQPKPAEAAPAPTPVPAPAAAPAPSEAAPGSGRGKVTAGIALAAVGVALCAGGATFGALAQSISDQFTKPKNPDTDRFDPALDSRGRTYQALEIVGLAAGGAAIVTGVVLLVVGQRESHKVSVAPALGRGLAGVALSGSF